jgi:hypothetical protein
MPFNGAVPPPYLPLQPIPEEITHRFPGGCGVRIERDDLLGTDWPDPAGARLPEPPESREPAGQAPCSPGAAPDGFVVRDNCR